MPKLKDMTKISVPNKSVDSVKVEQPQMAAWKALANSIASKKAAGLGKLKGLK